MILFGTLVLHINEGSAWLLRMAEIKLAIAGTRCRLQQMSALLQKTLKVVPAPLIEGVPTAPPVLEVPNPTVECKCGNCGAVLMRGEEGKAYPLLVHCVSCGSYNSTDI